MLYGGIDVTDYAALSFGCIKIFWGQLPLVCQLSLTPPLPTEENHSAHSRGEQTTPEIKRWGEWWWWCWWQYNLHVNNNNRKKKKNNDYGREPTHAQWLLKSDDRKNGDTDDKWWQWWQCPNNLTNLSLHFSLFTTFLFITNASFPFLVLRNCFWTIFFCSSLAFWALCKELNTV